MMMTGHIVVKIQLARLPCYLPRHKQLEFWAGWVCFGDMEEPKAEGIPAISWGPLDFPGRKIKVSSKAEWSGGRGEATPVM